MSESRFEIIFMKLREELAADGDASPEALPSDELAEIEELRRIVLEVLEEPAMLYTTT